jgi:hypothetical protein
MTDAAREVIVHENILSTLRADDVQLMKLGITLG